ncbi:MAG: ectonucleotide pyrophosphatase/phosphodiesterase [Tepidisphaeraceae bacterium]
MQRLATLVSIGIAVAVISAAPTSQPAAKISRVIIISIDGGRPDLLLRGDTPRIHSLFENGSYTFWARTTPGAVTLPAHVSMLTGVAPEVHGIMWNAELPLSEAVYPNAPTLFELAKRAGHSTAMIATKAKFRVLAKPATIDWVFVPATGESDDEQAAASAKKVIREHRPDVMFVHLGAVDIVGHAKGWGSPEQMQAVAATDRNVGAILDALSEQNLSDTTLVIVTADHGGAGRTHGPEDARSRTIPWIAFGPGVRRGFDLTRLGGDFNVETYDTFATACGVLGIPPPRRGSRGKFITQILENQDLVLPERPPKMDPTTRP